MSKALPLSQERMPRQLTNMKTYWMKGYRGQDVQMSEETTRANIGPEKWDELQEVGYVKFCGYTVVIRYT